MIVLQSLALCGCAARKIALSMSIYKTSFFRKTLEDDVADDVTEDDVGKENVGYDQSPVKDEEAVNIH